MTTADRPWLDPNLSLEDRVETLLSQMTLEEKAGQMFQHMITMAPGGELSEGDAAFALPSTADYLNVRHMTHFNLLGPAPSAREMARWSNHLQRAAQDTRLGIPVTVSTDPRNGFSDNPGAALLAGPFSQWPEPLGLAATRDTELVEQFGDIARREYLAVGLRAALHPQVDLATEPRWARQLQTFGEDAKLSGELGAAYVRGFQGATFGPGSVSAMIKHFPGGGPQLDGEDPHFAYGREQVYPGGQFELHLEPFLPAFADGVRQVMPYYGMPVGTQYEEVAFGFNGGILTGLLRDRLGFDGVVCTDWGLITDQELLGAHFPARAWGVEDLTPSERIIKAVNAGVDQFGGEAAPELLIAAVRDGHLDQARIDVSVRRLLREKFLLGLFDEPFVDEAAADSIVGAPEFRASGDYAQRKSITVLHNAGALPFARGIRLYVEGIDPEVAAEYGTVVETPGEADLAVLRIGAPYEDRGTAFENFFHAGSLDFAAPTLDHLREVAAVVPTVVDVFLDRPAILEPVVDLAAGVVANWGAHSRAVLDVLSGAFPASGQLPFDIPRSMAAVQASREDVPFDTADPLYRFGHGLSL